MRSGCYSQPHAARRLLRLACRCAWHGTATAVISSVRDAWLSTHSATHGDVLHLRLRTSHQLSHPQMPAQPAAVMQLRQGWWASAAGPPAAAALYDSKGTPACAPPPSVAGGPAGSCQPTHTQMQHVRTRCGMRGAMVAGLNKSVAGRASLHTMVRQCATTQTPSAAFCGTCQSTASCTAGLYDEKILTAAH